MLLVILSAILIVLCIIIFICTKPDSGLRFALDVIALILTIIVVLVGMVSLFFLTSKKEVVNQLTEFENKMLILYENKKEDSPYTYLMLLDENVKNYNNYLKRMHDSCNGLKFNDDFISSFSYYQLDYNTFELTKIPTG